MGTTTMKTGMTTAMTAVMTQTIKVSGLGMATLLCSSLLLLSGCGSSFSSPATTATTSQSPSGSGGNTGSGTGAGTGSGTSTPSPAPLPVDSRWQSATMDGSIGGNAFFPAVQVVRLDKVSKQLVLSLPLPSSLSLLNGFGVQVPLEDIPGATAGIEVLAAGGSALVLRVPLSYLMKGIDSLPSNRLPNGDPLPAIPDGELPSMAVQLNASKDIKATIYLAVQTLGIFVNTPFDPYLGLTMGIMGSNSKLPLGYISTIPAHKKPRAATDGGFFISVRIPDDLARIIDDNL